MAKSKKLSPLRQAVQDAHEDYFWALQYYHASDEYKKFEEKRKKMEKKHPRLKAHAFGNGWWYAEPIRVMYEDVKEIILNDPLLFIDVSKADKVQKKALTEWLRGQTLPVIPGVDMACFTWDYDRFYHAFVRGNVATVND